MSSKSKCGDHYFGKQSISDVNVGWNAVKLTTRPELCRHGQGSSSYRRNSSTKKISKMSEILLGRFTRRKLQTVLAGILYVPPNKTKSVIQTFSDGDVGEKLRVDRLTVGPCTPWSLRMSIIKIKVWHLSMFCRYGWNSSLSSESTPGKSINITGSVPFLWKYYNNGLENMTKFNNILLQ